MNLADVYEQIRGSDSVGGIHRALRQWTLSRNFQYYSLVMFGPPADSVVLSIDAYPRGWLCGYVMRELRSSDPGSIHSATALLPVRTRSGDSGTLCGMAEHDGKFGIVGALVTPLRGAGGQWGWMRFAHTVPQERNEVAGVEADSIAVSYCALGRLLELTKPAAASALTKRQIECLRLAADGHRGKKIAKLLSITERSVKFHFEQSFKRLSAKNRTEAVSMARRQGIIP